MPGYTKTQLFERGAHATQYAWCRHCRLYWSKRSIKRHRHVGSAALTVVLDIPPSPKPKKGDVVILHPAHEQFLNFLADAIVKDLLAEQRARPAPPTNTASPKQTARRPASGELGEEAFAGSGEELDYAVLTVDEAVNKVGLTRAAIMAEFEGIQKRHDERLQQRRRRANRSKDRGQAT